MGDKDMLLTAPWLPLRQQVTQRTATIAIYVLDLSRRALVALERDRCCEAHYVLGETLAAWPTMRADMGEAPSEEE
eukprot:845291-Rhodomonas_salina.1